MHSFSVNVIHGSSPHKCIRTWFLGWLVSGKRNWRVLRLEEGEGTKKGISQRSGKMPPESLTFVPIFQSHAVQCTHCCTSPLVFGMMINWARFSSCTVFKSSWFLGFLINRRNQPRGQGQGTLEKRKKSWFLFC